MTRRSKTRRSNHALRRADLNAWSLPRYPHELTPAFKALRRLVRRVRQAEQRARRPFYIGYSLNHPRVGDILVHFNDGADGVRRDIRINPWGVMRRFEPAAKFVPEIWEEEAA